MISVIGMPVQPTLGIKPLGHNTSGAGLLTPLRVGTIVTMPITNNGTNETIDKLKGTQIINKFITWTLMDLSS